MSQRYASRRKVLAFLACVLLFILLLYETHEEETKHRSLTRDRLAAISLLTLAFPSYAIPLPALCLFLFSSVCVSSCSSLTTLSSSTSLLSSPSSFSARSPFPSFPSLSSSSSLSSPLFSSSSASFSSSLPSSISLPSSFPDNKLLEELTTAAGTPAASRASSFMVSTAAPPPVVLSNRATATTAAAATASQNSKPPTGESAATLYKRHELEAATPPSTGAAAETAPPRADARHSDVDISPFIGTRQHNILMASVEREGQRQRVAEGREFIYPVDSPLLQQQKQQSQSHALSPQQQALEALSVRAEAEAAEREEGERDTGLERVTTREEDKGEDEYRAGPEEKEEKEEKGKERIAVRYRSFSNDVPEQPSALLTSFPLLSSSSSSSDLNSPFLPALSLQSAAAKGAALPSDEELPVSVALVTSRVSETEETVNEGKKSSDSKKYTNPSSISTSTKTGDERLHHRKIQGYGNSKNYQRSRKGSEGRHNRRSESPSSRHTLQRGIKSGNTNRGEQFIQFDDAGMHCSSVRESDSTGRYTQQVFRDDQKHSSNSSTSCTSYHCGNSEKRKVPSVEESRVNSEVAEEVGDDLKPEGCGKFCRNISKDNVWQRHRHGCGHGLHGKSVTHTDGSNIAKNEGKVAGAEKWSGIKESVNGDNESIRGERGGSNSSTGNESDEEGGDAKHGALWRSTKVSTMRGEHEHPEGRNRERNKRLGNKRNNNNEERESHFSSSPSNKLATMRHSDSPGLRIEKIKSSQPVTSRAPITRWNIVQQPLLVNSDDSRKDREESVTTEGEEEEAAKMGQGGAPVLDKEERTVSSERPPTPDTETTPLVKTSSVDNGVFNTTSAASSSGKPTITDIIASNSTRPVIAGAKSDAPADAESVSARHVLPAVSSPSSSMSPSSDSLAPSSVHFPSSSAPSPSTPSSSGSSSVASSSPSFPSSTSTVRPSSSSSAPSSSVTSPSSPASASSRALPWRKSANREASNSPPSRKSTTEDSNKAIVVVESSSSSWIEEWRWLWLILMSFFLVVIAGIASGLTTGLMAFDELQLLVVLQTGIGSERQQAEAVCNLMRRNRHQLLVTLLLCNALAMEALPLFLDRLVSPVLAVLLSVSAILFVGEILPQALCTGPYQLAIAATLAPFVRLLLILFWPAAYPISRLLDCWLSEKDKPSLYARAHLKALIGLHERARVEPLLLQHRMETHTANRAHTTRRGLSLDKTLRRVKDQEFVAICSDSPERRRENNLEGSSNITKATTAACAAAKTVAVLSGAAGTRAARAAEARTARDAGEASITATGSAEERELEDTATTATLKTCSRQRRKAFRERDGVAEGDDFENRRGEGATGSGEQDFFATATRTIEEKDKGPTEHGESRMEADAEDFQHAVGLHRDEVLIMQGALDMACKSVCELMVPLKDVFMLEASVRLTRPVLIDILAKGHSRIPIFEKRRENIRGVLLMKSLVLIDPGAGVRVADLMQGRTFRRLCTPLFVAPTINPYQLLNEFQEGRCHLAFVTRHVAAYQRCWEGNTSVPAGAQLLGIVTLEDVIEELIQEEILDEFDRRFRAESSSSIPFVERPSSTSLCLRAMQHSASYASGQAMQPGELCNALQLRRGQPHQLVGELRQPADVARTGAIGGDGNEIDRLGSSGTDGAALSRFASLLLAKNKEPELRKDKRQVADTGRSATSILASSQLGSRASLLFASASDVECCRALDHVWGDLRTFSPRPTHIGRRPQQQGSRDRRRRKSAYFPISKHFTATYRPVAHLRSSTTKHSVLAKTSTSTSPQLTEALLSTSPLSGALNRHRGVLERHYTTTTGMIDAASPGRTGSTPYEKEHQCLYLRDVSSRARRSSHEES